MKWERKGRQRVGRESESGVSMEVQKMAIYEK